MVAHFVAGDTRGSHHMPLMPVAINTAVTGPYCLPIVSCMAYSLTPQGRLSEAVDIFGNVAWDATRLKAQRKGEEMRQQGFVGAAMLPMQELEYSAFRHSLAALEAEFQMRETVVHSNRHALAPVAA
jgi:fructose 1,6-bisphosphate aldolase/phosphatase